MTWLHAFEFMDQPWMPSSLRTTLREALECANGWPFRLYYAWAVEEILRTAHKNGIHTIIELGCGTAPLARRLAADSRSSELKIIICDINPDLEAFAALQKKYPKRIFPISQPVDFSKPHSWEPNGLLVLSATMHHLHRDARVNLLHSLTSSDTALIVFEPLRKNVWSFLFVCGGVVPALFLPLRFFLRKGRLRRILWCWLLPLAPLLFCWDGFVSSLRQWTKKEWFQALNTAEIPLEETSYLSTLFCQRLSIAAKPTRESCALKEVG